MSKLQTRIENLEGQTGPENVQAEVFVYSLIDGTCTVGNQQYASRAEAEAAHPCQIRYFLPCNGRDKRVYP